MCLSNNLFSLHLGQNNKAYITSLYSPLKSQTMGWNNSTDLNQPPGGEWGFCGLSFFMLLGKFSPSKELASREVSKEQRRKQNRPNLPLCILRGNLTATRQSKSSEFGEQINCRGLNTLPGHTVLAWCWWIQKEGGIVLPSFAVLHCQTAKGILLCLPFKGPLLSWRVLGQQLWMGLWREITG